MSNKINNMPELRKHLFQSIEDTITGKISYRQATAISGLANTVVSVVKVELEYARIAGKDLSYIVDDIAELKE